MVRVLFTVAFAVAILVSVSLHEAGHLLTAKRFGMRVTQYFVGYGPTIFSWRRGGTEYGLKAVPLGGFCKIVGMTPDDDVDPADQHRAMWRFPVWKRTVVMASGVLVQFALAVVALWFAAAYVGVPNRDYPQSEADLAAQPAAITVGDCVTPDAVRPCTSADPVAPAKAAGLRTGDVLTALNGVPISTYAEMLSVVRQARPGPAEVAYTRDGRPAVVRADLSAVRRPPLDDPAGPVGTVAALGVGLHISAPREVTFGPAGAVGATVTYSGWLVEQTYESAKRIPSKIPALWHSITGGERDPNTPVSVVGVSLIGGEAASLGLWSTVLMIFIGLNVFMGFFNLLPLLPLDGGHIAIAWFERVRAWVAARLGRPEPGQVDYLKLMPLTYTVILIGGAFTLLTVAADIINPITIR
ncbi:M50 family metallopeptidase [Jidongwangia harbinensis]|uniref:M50 family metallopeptidase n=1 Tax=Jidongwangia harbinensis TaxID=2878561 RepID=UPI001CD98AFB|nr:site-2 protease family protein [Jidongwangia harbinensis]MCA2213611.1 site-2 protease family protein [Jidongwangia harbinensis]